MCNKYFTKVKKFHHSEVTVNQLIQITVVDVKSLKQSTINEGNISKAFNPYGTEIGSASN